MRRELKMTVEKQFVFPELVDLWFPWSNNFVQR